MILKKVLPFLNEEIKLQRRIMQKLTIILLSLFLLTMFSCSKSNDSNKQLSSNTAKNEAKVKSDALKKADKDFYVETWEDKRAKGVTTYYKNNKVKGGLLLKSGSIGNIEVKFDKNLPRSYKSVGKVQYYKTNGNLQIFVKRSSDLKNKKFEGKNVDIYYTN